MKTYATISDTIAHD